MRNLADPGQRIIKPDYVYSKTQYRAWFVEILEDRDRDPSWAAILAVEDGTGEAECSRHSKHNLESQDRLDNIPPETAKLIKCAPGIVFTVTILEPLSYPQAKRAADAARAAKAYNVKIGQALYENG